MNCHGPLTIVLSNGGPFKSRRLRTTCLAQTVESKKEMLQKSKNGDYIEALTMALFILQSFLDIPLSWKQSCKIG